MICAFMLCCLLCMLGLASCQLRYMPRHGQHERHKAHRGVSPSHLGSAVTEHEQQQQQPHTAGMEPARPERSLRDVSVIVLLLRSKAAASRWLTSSGLGHYEVLDEKSLNQTCASLHPDHPCRLEHALRFAHSHLAHKTLNWFVFTTGEVWWYDGGLAAELLRAERLLLPAVPAQDVLMIGGGGLLTFSHFMILSRAALELVGDPAFIHRCRSTLLACDASSRGSGCGFKANPSRAHSRGGYFVSKDELMHYCLGSALAKGRCGGGSGSGCEWTFGKLSNRPVATPEEGATPARRRFVSNVSKRPPKAAVHALLRATASRRRIEAEARQQSGENKNKTGLIKRSIIANGATAIRHVGPLAAEEAGPCEVREAMRGLVAFENADEAGVTWLEELRSRGSLCKQNGGGGRL